jgi:hypothetical protein
MESSNCRSDHMSNSERYSIAVITLEERMFREMRRVLAANFRVALASTESQIKLLIDDPKVHAIVVDLESIGDEPRDGVAVVQEIRRLCPNLILVAITKSSSSSRYWQARLAPIIPSTCDSDDDDAVEGRPALGAVPSDELVDGVLVHSTRGGRSKAVEYCPFANDQDPTGEATAGGSFVSPSACPWPRPPHAARLDHGRSAWPCKRSQS